MSINPTPLRLGILVACLAAFWSLGGFTPLEDRIETTSRLHVKSQRAWFHCVIAFVAGAVSVSLVDHKVGLLDPINLRFAYILLGIALMVLGILWNHSLVTGLEARFGNG